MEINDRDERMAKFQEVKKEVRRRSYRNLLILGVVLVALVAVFNIIDFPESDQAGNQNATEVNSDVNAGVDENASAGLSEDNQPRVSIIITAESILDNLDSFNPDKLSIVPDDGIVFPQTEIAITEGETAFDLLARVIKDNKIHFDHEYVPAWGSNYIKGIANIYEMDAGPMSGWAFQVNGDFAPVSADQYELEDGDSVEWVYFCDFGFELDE